MLIKYVLLALVITIIQVVSNHFAGWEDRVFLYGWGTAMGTSLMFYGLKDWLNEST